MPSDLLRYISINKYIIWAYQRSKYEILKISDCIVRIVDSFVMIQGYGNDINIKIKIKKNIWNVHLYFVTGHSISIDVRVNDYRIEYRFKNDLNISNNCIILF